MAGFVKNLAALGRRFASLDSLLEMVVGRVVVMVAHQRTAWPFGRKFVPLQPQGVMVIRRVLMEVLANTIDPKAYHIDP